MTTQTTIATLPVSDACVGQGGCWQYGSTSAAVFGSAGRFSKSQPPRRVAFSAPSSLSQRATGSLLHTGKEKDPETGYSYFGVRYLEHELMTSWLSVDPMADKYPSISPYAYCAWNPLKLVDPKGEEIIIKDGKWRWYYYIDGHVYLKSSKGNILMDSKLSDNGKEIKGNLDEMSQHKSGKKVVDRLTKSKEKYFISIDADKANGHYDSKSNNLYIGEKDNNSAVLSHELFHAYQDDHGRIPRTIYNEVEAYVFSQMISGESLGVKSDKNAKYVDHGKILVLVFDPNSFNYLLNHFCKDSKANYKGTYDNYGFNPGNYSPNDSLLKDL